MVDTRHFPILGEGGERYILTGETGMRGDVRELRKRFGDQAHAILYYIGFSRGIEVYETLLKPLGAGAGLRKTLELLLLYGHQRGRYRGRIAKYAVQGRPGDTIILHIYDNWECLTVKQLGIPGPASPLERGVIAAVVEQVTGRRVSVEEPKCIAKGDPYCVFRIVFET